MEEDVLIIGGGLAGCEAAALLSRAGVKARLVEMKPVRFSEAHKMDGLAELVCSNSLKSESMENASGVLKAELRAMGSILMEAADRTRVAAGKALAVDRRLFSEFVTARLDTLGVNVTRREVTGLPVKRPLIIATGPLTSPPMAEVIEELTGKGSLYFYDAIAPIVYGESIDFSSAFMGSRYGKGGDDYVNCPLTKDEYYLFVKELTAARTAPVREFEEKKFFESCMPVEVMAMRGVDTLAFGPMRPTGFVDPQSGKRPYALVQLRREDKGGALYNAVGFQTRLTNSEQKRVFSFIPALKNAEFARYGSMHRNTFIDSPRLLTPSLELKDNTGIFFAGQITGVEGYVESAASGIAAGIGALMRLRGSEPQPFPGKTLTGALMSYVTDDEKKDFQPMNANFGLLSANAIRREEAGVAAVRAVEEYRKFLQL
ncbi:MAG: methylenetetrahydrofolate--tRNA-(uracil(54)-C(5))-methyltransferase (FADH(2)-oxidizing) TrmFO [Deltaproteobacteria bacterium]|nr:methylenetetrahydrofolate--tRNA-(uracil(54)-C(5))-methyltransferase (FADH(2)-oxidizing) TrmFO [Deltaproteobacteria bacterium]